MMKREQVLQIIHNHQEQIEQFGVASLALFGSVARDQAGPESDVDFLVEFSRPVGLFKLAELQLFLEDILGSPVDLGTSRSLKPRLKESVLEEAIRVA
jgi:predicted nucleotidyltransferase